MTTPSPLLVFHILTLFPNLFPGPLAESITGRALHKKIWALNAINIRDFATDTHKTVDDIPYGGGAGMVMKADVIEAATRSIQTPGRLIYLSPRGRVFDQALAAELVTSQNLTFLCGRYEGVDQRAIDAIGFEEISLGDFVLSGGEIAAYPILDSIIRLLPHVVGNDETLSEESFSSGLLEYPHYTRPAEWMDANGLIHKVPDVLLSGHHADIKKWREAEARALTQARRPDLWAKHLKDK